VEVNININRGSFTKSSRQCFTSHLHKK
jgi:hypothetical protein